MKNKSVEEYVLMHKLGKDMRELDNEPLSKQYEVILAIQSSYLFPTQTLLYELYVPKDKNGTPLSKYKAVIQPKAEMWAFLYADLGIKQESGVMKKGTSEAKEYNTNQRIEKSTFEYVATVSMVKYWLPNAPTIRQTFHVQLENNSISDFQKITTKTRRHVVMGLGGVQTYFEKQTALKSMYEMYQHANHHSLFGAVELLIRLTRYNEGYEKWENAKKQYFLSANKQNLLSAISEIVSNSVSIHQSLTEGLVSTIKGYMQNDNVFLPTQPETTAIGTNKPLQIGQSVIKEISAPYEPSAFDRQKISELQKKYDVSNEILKEISPRKSVEISKAYDYLYHNLDGYSEVVDESKPDLLVCTYNALLWFERTKNEKFANVINLLIEYFQICTLKFKNK